MTDLPREFPLPSDAFERQRSVLGTHVAAGRSRPRLARRRAVAALVVVLVGGLLVAPAPGIGTRLLALIDPPGIAAEIWGVAWSPDGRRIAFHEGRDRNTEIHVVNADGSGERLLVSAEAWSPLPVAWSPDGTKLAVASRRDGHDEFSVVNADGSGTLTLKRAPAPKGGHTAQAPAWSPDGRKLVFATVAERGSEIYTVNADGSRLRRLSREPVRDPGLTWSPDGRRITFVTARSGRLETYVMNPDGSGRARLSRSAGGAGHRTRGDSHSRATAPSTLSAPTGVISGG